MPATSPDEAMWALDRLREDLVLRLTSAEVPAFTASFGVAEWTPGFRSEEVLGQADAALLKAKETGRNKIVIDGTAAASDGQMPTVRQTNSATVA
jgi:PleD family two-component response regulator